MLFALICTDKPNSLETRMACRPDHLKFLEGLGDRLKAAGPLTNDEGTPNGSLIVIEADSREDVEAIAAEDPYEKADLFSTVQIRAWKWLLKNPEGQA